MSNTFYLLLQGLGNIMHHVCWKFSPYGKKGPKHIRPGLPIDSLTGPVWEDIRVTTSKTRPIPTGVTNMEGKNLTNLNEKKP